VRVSDFHFDLPEDLIAQHPPAARGSSRMLVLNRALPIDHPGALTDDLFANLPNHLRPGDLLVLNDTRVLPARLFATRAGLTTQPSSPTPTGLIEVLLTEHLETAHPSENIWRALVKPARKVRPGETLHFFSDDRKPRSQNDAVILNAVKDPCISSAVAQKQTPLSPPLLTAEVLSAGPHGERTLCFAPTPPGEPDFYARIARIGHMPLPPYIHRSAEDEEEDKARYQTIYSQTSNPPGSAAAPTAGLHFTPEVLAALQARGVEIAYLTLHVGLGTFQPVRVEELADIRLHAEPYTLPAATAEALNRALRDRRRIVAVGTTTTRALEHIAQAHIVQAHIVQAHIATQPRAPHLASEMWVSSESQGISPNLEPHSGSTSIFLAPGHRFRIVSGLLTNFHLPQSTLLMLAAAFAGDATNPGAGAPELGAPEPALSLPKGLASETWVGPPQPPPEKGLQVILAAYAHAIRHGYRFYSYGDCMLLL
jgi:S-adenosylmethionine:tRNA ribosyltransferase-isomerase